MAQGLDDIKVKELITNSEMIFGYSGGNRRYGQGDRGGNRGGDFNNYSRNRRDDSFQNGYNDRRGGDDWNRGNNRGGFRENERAEPPISTNDRWQEPEKRDSTQFGGKWKDDAGTGGGGGRSIPRGGT